MVYILFIYLFSEFFILYLFGNQYADSITVLKILALNSIFMSIHLVGSKWYFIEGLGKLALIRNILGIMINIYFNYLMIPKYGLKGAAISSLFAIIFIGYIFDIFNKKTIIQFKLKTSGMFYLNLLLKN